MTFLKFGFRSWPCACQPAGCRSISTSPDTGFSSSNCKTAPRKSGPPSALAKPGCSTRRLFPSAVLQLVALEALVLPDGLQQFFRRRGTAVAQHVDGAAAFAPDGVEIFRAGTEFCTRQSQAAFAAGGGDAKSIYFERNQAVSCLFNAGSRRSFCSPQRGFSGYTGERFFTVHEADD